MILLDGVKQELYGMVDCAPLENSCEVFDGELIHKKWDENDSENFDNNDNTHILLKWRRGSLKMAVRVKIFKKCNMPP